MSPRSPGDGVSHSLVSGLFPLASEQRFQLIMDHVPLMAWACAANRQRTWCNKPWLDFVGRTLEQELGLCWIENVHREDRKHCQASYTAAFAARQSFEVEYRLRRHDGCYRWVLDKGTPAHDADLRFEGFVGGCVDITEHRRIEAELRRERVFLRKVIDATPSMIFVKDREGRFLLGNEALARSCGTTVDQLSGRTDASFQRAARQIERFQATDLEVMTSGKPLHIPEEEITQADGQVRWLSTGKVPLFNENGTCDKILGVATDITEQRQVQEKLERAKEELEQRVAQRAAELLTANEKLVKQMEERFRLETALLDISEQEQRRLGQDLHDGLCQSLSGLVFMSRSLSKTLEEQGHDGPAASAARLTHLIHNSVEEARNIARGLHPVVMDAEGLVSALHELAARSSGILACRLRCERVVPIADNATALHLYRIAQEAVTNAIKHSGARRITLSLRLREGLLMLGVTDDGCGMPEVIPQSHGMGVRLMQYRADVIGANISIGRRKRGGTQVTCTLRMSHFAAEPGKELPTPDPK